jgi:hypothetical protein
MKTLAVLCTVAVVGVVCGTVAPAAAACGGVTFGSGFTSYTCNDLGQPPGVPSPLGGLTFLDSNTLLIGGVANKANSAIYQIGITRDAQNHVTGFSGTATLFATAPEIDGGLSFGPSGVLLFTGFPNNTLGEIKPGSSSPDRTIDLSSLSPPVASSVGTLAFVPAGFPGAGQLKIASYSASTWYTGTLTADGSGTFNLSVVQNASVSGLDGPEGIAYVHGNNSGFGVDSALISEYGADKVDAWAIDSNGDPIAGTAKDFLTGLSGAEGAVIDPVSGDFLFSTFGGGDRVLVISGLQPPTPPPSGPIPTLGGWGMFLLMVLLVGIALVTLRQRGKLGTA